ncbi:bifunctional DNA-formamidopyrimidine glycosylase/DNA-(apurinic or apyrimidinic site) lyase [Sediminivirga luteola]|uniref:Formamidopyrimidine-DNA glycosylase n=1 Tax=Sediminivirga luteola TaxID=1774748 RepID=A0A8J2TVB7_9MICO|nr:bifunctional DNA-formamidopyrimidine glycosylase/DNA-(apurinic or apyrimidinic site) lyase [Sediminivirga luteola]MCI2264593.1 bifunctional DNA-formamidopyrimidine glycosylase/DNA-(apurinic or apyrimidinic site) lyase [Sediminivirga luteola]GGA03157.1 formamidopyrimidine-DNA glycosylase [Sediminivirga luteola]
MPELPEVEVVRAGLARHVPGRRVESVEVLDARSVRRQPDGPAGFVAGLTGAVLGEPVRRGKFLWIPLHGRALPVALVAHLGMSGQILLHRADQPPDQWHRHTRIVLTLSAPERAVFDQIRFQDQRMFGGLHLAPMLPTADGAPAGHADGVAEALLPVPVSHIARDPLDPHLDPAEVLARMRRRRTGVKRALLDQGLISGIGNIYADEALWRAGVHYAAPTDTTRPARLEAVLRHCAEVMEQALAEGGTSFDDLYVNVNGESGYFDRSLNVYGRAGLPCRRCGEPVRRETFMNRGSHFCPRCQRRPRNPRW